MYQIYLQYVKFSTILCMFFDSKETSIKISWQKGSYYANFVALFKMALKIMYTFIVARIWPTKWKKKKKYTLWWDNLEFFGCITSKYTY